MTGFKENILAIAFNLGISETEFRSSNIHEWPRVMKKIETNFIIKKNSNTKFNWWWDDLKGGSYSLSFKNDDAYQYLDQIIPQNETIWFVACDSGHDPSKFWLFEGKIRSIQKVIEEHHYFEYYLISKKYKWFLFENDHSILIGLGEIILEMKSFANLSAHGRFDVVGL